MATSVTTSQSGVTHWLVLVTACLAGFVVALNTTAVMTALPDIKDELDLDSVATQWVINIYMLVSAVLLVIIGRFADILGKLRVLATGIGVLAAGSVLIMAAENFPLKCDDVWAQGDAVSEAHAQADDRAVVGTVETAGIAS